jgi:hypothetical protein
MWSLYHSIDRIIAASLTEINNETHYVPKKKQKKTKKQKNKKKQDKTARIGFALSVNLQGSRSSDYTIRTILWFHWDIG